MNIGLSDSQADILETAYSACANPSRNFRQRISIETGLNMRTIQSWFRNKRFMNRKYCQQDSMKNKSVLFHELLMKSGNKQGKPLPANNTEWLTTALAANIVPPNIELSPDDIRNGEVCVPYPVLQGTGSFDNCAEISRWHPSL